jgi:polysaccharide export outer membrane protein
MLLAGMGAMVGLCLAGAGCQPNLLRPDATAVGTDAAAPSGPIVSVVHKQNADSVPAEAVVSMLRPVPVSGTPAGNVVVASAWQPIQRASSEELQAKAPPAETVQTGAPGPLPTPVDTPAAVEIAPPATLAGNADKPADADKKDKDAKDEATVLHPPTALPPATVVGPVAHVVPDVPKEFSKQSLPPYVVEPPDILLIQSSQKILDQPLAGQHLVRPDGYISLGQYGEVYVAGMSLDQVRAAITAQVKKKFPEFDPRTLDVDVIAYNSKVYYVITDGGGYGEQVFRVPVTGNETVLDAISQIQGLPAVASKKRVWLARATPGDGGHPIVLPVDWCRITQLGAGATNYQVYPGDRIYVGSDPWIRTDSWFAKRLAPVERLLGVTLLGSSTVNSIRNRSTTGTVP